MSVKRVVPLMASENDMGIGKFSERTGMLADELSAVNIAALARIAGMAATQRATTARKKLL